MDSSVMTSMRVSSHRQLGGGFVTRRDKSDRATAEQVLDPRTRMVLFKMLNSGVFSEINGCISTGKEANVYHACTSDGTDLAIKVYKTSILVFKDRDRYVTGDYRFKTGFCKSNPRKMVKSWAEKEMRNLMRLHTAGIRCPRPVQLRMHVLVMDFVGADGRAAPRLKDANIPLQQLRSMYTDMVLLIRTLYQECRLVHADLSEYNILVHEGELWIIDVSQAVDLDHPHALEFLREDATHVNAFFRRAGIATLTTRELFDFAVDPSIHAGNLAEALEQLQEVASSRPVTKEYGEAQDTNDRVFSASYIPRRLEEVTDYEEHHDRLQAGGGDSEGIYYQGITGMKADMSGARLYPAIAETAHERQPANQQHAPESDSGAEDSEDGSDSAASSCTDVDEAGSADKGQPPSHEQRQQQRKAHKKCVKEEKRQRRMTKTPKKVKKKAEKKGKQHK
eukprot:jgi/Astpho2/1973/Aster-00482